MKTELLLISLLALAGTSLFFMDNSNEEFTSEDLETKKIFNLYEAWKSKYGKNVNDGFEDAYRFSVFRENHYFVEEHNSENTEVDALQLELNEYGAMTNEEFASSMFGENFAEAHSEEALKDVTYVNDEDFVGNGSPNKWDWSAKGAVNPSMQQGVCGSCWTFSSTASLESLSFNQDGNLQKFSEQQILSCTPGPYARGCSGGNTYFGFMYTKSKGCQTEQTYPYTDAGTKVASPCEYDGSKTVFRNTGGSTSIKPQRPDAMRYFASQQVLSVAINATSIYFQLYKGGIMQNTHCPTDLNHAVNIVGYDWDNEIPYWIVKNSWGPKWGEGGKLRMAAYTGPGLCGINMSVNFPTM